MPKRRAIKELEKEERKLERRELTAYEHMIKLLNSEKTGMSPQQMHAISKSLKHKSQQQIDVGYIRTVLFPELYSYDIPQPLSNISFSRFTDKQECTISTGNDGANGSGMLLWYPKVNFGPSLFVYQCSTAALDNALPIPLLTGKTMDPAKWKVGFIQQYDQAFQQTCLVAGAISIQYVGQLQTESGYFVGGQVFSAGIDQLTVDDIENAQFRVLAKPGEGIRLLSLPKDSTDYTYYPVKTGNSHNTGSAGANEDQFALKASTDYQAISTFSAVSGGKYTPAADITYMNNSTCLAVYWKGLAPNQNVIRIDATRRFNGIPKQSIRDMVDVSRPKRQYDAKKTSDVVSQLILSVPQVGGHSIKQMDRVSDQIQSYLPNIGHLYSSGLLREGLTLQGLSSGLALQQAGLEGPTTSSGRIWDND